MWEIETYTPQVTSSSFDPLSLITGGGSFWRADRGITQSSGNVSAWADQSGSGNTLTPTSATQPVWSANSFGAGFSGVTFDGTANHALQVASFLFNSPTATVFCLVQVPSPVILGRNMSFVADSTQGDYNTVNSITIDLGSSSVRYEYNNTGSSGAVPITANVPYLAGAVLDGANVNLWVNGVLANDTHPQGGNLGGVSPTPFVLLGTGWVTGALSNSIAQTTAFAGVTALAMGQNDWTNLKNWANANWGTAF